MNKRGRALWEEVLEIKGFRKKDAARRSRSGATVVVDFAKPFEAVQLLVVWSEVKHFQMSRSSVKHGMCFLDNYQSCCADFVRTDVHTFVAVE